MTDFPFLTLYVPVHNGAGWIERCLSSLSRLPAGVEVLVVDDASGDGSAEMAERWAGEGPGRGVIRRLERGGPGAASQTAIDAARGAWVQRVDADDEALPEGIAEAMEVARRGGVDVVCQPYFMVDEFGRRRLRDRRPHSSGIRADAYWIGWSPALWATMVSADLLSRGRIGFASVGVGEDLDWIAQVLSRVPLDRVGFTAEPSYLFDWNDSSTTRGMFREPGAVARHLDGPHRQSVDHYLSTLDDLVARDLLGAADRMAAQALVHGQRMRMALRGGERGAALREWRALQALRPFDRFTMDCLRRLMFPRWLRRPATLFASRP